MKTPKNSINSNLGRASKFNLLILAAAAAMPVTTGLAQTLWIGSTGDYNNPASWNGTYNGGSNPNTSNDNGSNNVVLIQPGDPLWQHGDTLAGNGDNTSGAYLQTGSTNNTGGGNWLRMGIGNNSYGSYVLSNGVVNVGGRTQIGEHGTGYLEIDGGIYNGNVNDGGANPAMVCGQGDFGPGTGTLVINGGTVTYGRETWFGQNGGSTGTGYFFMNGGTLNVNDWFVFGRNGAQGYGVMTGGTLNFHGGGQFLIGGGGIGALAQSGGTINAFNQYLVPQGDGGISASGTNSLSGNAILNVHSWVAIGRGNGYGELNISGNAAMNRDNSSDGGSHFDIGAGGTGVVNQNGGVITESTSDLWLGEGATATWNLNSGSAHVQKIVMSVNNGITSTLNLNGGLLQASGINSSSTLSISTLNFNGGTLQATGNNDNFITGLFQMLLSSGGAVIDSQGYNITIPQALQDNGGGSLTKTGTGTLTLAGGNSYSGDTIINGGNLFTTTASTTSGSLTLADNAGFGIGILSGGAQYSVQNLTLGNSVGSSLGFDMGSFGNPGLSQAPLVVNGTLTKKGVTTVNVADSLPQLGQFPLIKYPPGGLTGSGSFVVGSLPVGVSASIVTNIGNNSIDLNITAVSQLRWDGNAGGTWDLGSDTDWVNIGSGLPAAYTDTSSVVFNDQAGTPTVNLTTTVKPLGVTVNNDSINYSIVGSGKISGAIGINKNGTGSLALLNTGGNDFTGPVTINGGTLSVTNVANAGVASAIGKGSLVLAGGNFSYSGPATSINRGYSLQGANLTSGIDVESNLTLSGVVTAAVGDGFVKTGPARLAYTTVGNNQLASAGYQVQAGSLLLDGSAGGQTNNISGTLSIGGTVNSSATLTNTTVNTGSDTGIGNVANTIGSMEVDSGTTLTVNSWLLLGDGANATASLTMNGGIINVPNGRFFLCSAPGTMATFTMNGGTINKSGDYFAVVNGNWNGAGARTGVVNQVNGTINCQSECWIGDAGGAGNGSLGIYNLSGGALNLGSWFGVGRDGSTGIFHMTGGTLYKAGGGDMVIGRGGSAGTFTMSAGTINKDAGNPIIVGQGQGTGEFDQSGGTINCASEYWVGVDGGTFSTNNISGSSMLNMSNWVSLGRSGTATVNFSGGTFYKTSNGQFIVGDNGTCVFSQSGSAALNDDNELWIGQAGTGNGTFNLTNGTVNVGSWLAVGRESGQGVLNIYNGSMTTLGGGNISIAHNDNATGTVNMYGGAFTNITSDTWIGENGVNAIGRWNMYGGLAVLGHVSLAQNDNNVRGILTLNGGTLAVSEIGTGNTGAPQRELDLNGGTLVAEIDNANFIHDLTAANVQSGGAIINTASHSVAVNQALLGVSPDGGLTKIGTGTLYLNGANTYTNSTLVNAGGLGGIGTIMGRVTVASGAELAPGTDSIGTLTVNNALSLASGSTTLIKITMDGGATNDVVQGLTSVSYAGTLVVTNVGASALVGGTQFHVFKSAGAGSGGFTSVTVLPSGSGTFNPATGILTITSSGSLTVNPPKVSGGNLILTGTGGTAGESYSWLTATNLATPLASWTTNLTGVFMTGGTFSNAIPVNSSTPDRFFRLKTP